MSMLFLKPTKPTLCKLREMEIRPEIIDKIKK